MFTTSLGSFFRTFLRMSYCEDHGKDKVVFVDKSYNAQPSKVELKEYEDDYNRGLILPNGDINFNCPCLGGMASGPCGVEFREAFSCFHYSTNEVKGSECVDKFMEMQDCMTKYPKLYSKENDAMSPEVLESNSASATTTTESALSHSK